VSDAVKPHPALIRLQQQAAEWLINKFVFGFMHYSAKRRIDVPQNVHRPAYRGHRPQSATKTKV
jgi:hypothetical protein